MIMAERRWLILTSLGATAAVFLFFILAPVFGYPMRFETGLDVAKIIIPVFMGYLGTASQFVFARSRVPDPELHEAITPLFRILVRGPLIVFGMLILAGVIAFGYTNRPSAVIGTGMSVALLSAIVTGSLALLAVTTNAAVAYLFSSSKT